MSGANDLRPGCGVAASDVESKEEDITSYLKRSANEFDMYFEPLVRNTIDKPPKRSVPGQMAALNESS